MKTEPKKAYVYQPFPPQEDGMFYGVGGLHLFGLSLDEAGLRGISKKAAEEISRTCNESPERAASFIRGIKRRIAYPNHIGDCGCRFENDNSNSVLLCETCSELPCHSGGR